MALAEPAQLQASKKALAAAQAQAQAQHAQGAAARRRAADQAARAAQLAAQQVAAAAALRQLEDQTAQAAAALASLAMQAQQAVGALQQDEAALGALLPVIERLARAPAAAMLAVPAAPADAVRGVMVLQGVAIQIETKAEAVRTQAKLVAALQAKTQAQQAALGQAVATQQRAEAALSAQISAARGAETAELNDAARAAAAEATATQNVNDLRSIVDRLTANERTAEAAARVPAPLPAGNAKPALTPVAGTLFQSYGAPTPAGPAVGELFRAAPGARVVAPCGGPVLYANSFQSYGLLVILDCGRNFDFVLSGMQRLDVTAGQQVARGQPVGEMAGFDAAQPTRQPMLYLELRRNGKPVDPAGWGTGGSG